MFIVFETCGTVGFYIVFVTVREQSGDVCVVPETCDSTAHTKLTDNCCAYDILPYNYIISK